MTFGKDKIWVGREEIWTKERGVHSVVMVAFDFACDKYWQFIDLETIGM